MTDTSSNKTKDEMAREAKKTSDDLADTARQTAADAKDALRDEATHRAESAKEGVAGEVSDVASALRKAADDMRDGSPQERTFGQIAGTLADLSDTIRDKDLGQVANDVTEFAKRNPMLFLGGVALAGFAATRFAMATSRGDSTAHEPYAGARTGTSTGMSGPAGTQAATGTMGATGARGTPGTTGASGTSGAPTPTGPDAAPRPAGVAPGATGHQGDRK